MKLPLRLFLALPLALLPLACCPSFKTITVDQYFDRVDVGRYHSAHSFTYAGEDPGAYYFLERMPLSWTYGYRVPKGQGLALDVPFHPVDCEVGKWSFLRGDQIRIRGETLYSLFERIPPNNFRSPDENRP